MTTTIDDINQTRSSQVVTNVLAGVDDSGKINAPYVSTNGTLRVDVITGDGGAVIDEFVDALAVIETEHHQIHQGLGFRASTVLSIAGSSTTYYQFKIGAKTIHFKSRIIGSDKNVIIFRVYEAPTVTDGSSEVPIYNANRISATTSTVKIYTNPTNFSGGANIDTEMIVGTSTGSAAVTAGALTNEVEWVYKPNTNYVVTLENQGSGTAQFIFRYFWYEVA